MAKSTKPKEPKPAAPAGYEHESGAEPVEEAPAGYES